MVTQYSHTVSIDDHRNRMLAEVVTLALSGLWIVPIPGARKHPVLTGWRALRLKSNELSQHFSSGTTGFGVILGEPPGNLVDVDLDCPRAVFAAKLFPGPSTDRIKGRVGNPSSHYLFQVTDVVPRTRSFKDPKTDQMLVEVLSTGR